MSKIRERHGIPDARKVMPCTQDIQQVSVTDGDTDEVFLMIGTATHVAGMTPDQARYVALQLDYSASRIEARVKESQKK